MGDACGAGDGNVLAGGQNGLGGDDVRSDGANVVGIYRGACGGFGFSSGFFSSGFFSSDFFSSGFFSPGFLAASPASGFFSAAFFSFSSRAFFSFSRAERSVTSRARSK